MAPSARTTTDHAEIWRLAEEHGGQPVVRPAIGIVLPGASTTQVEPGSWHEWFQAFEQNGLALAFDEDGPSFELVPR